MGKYPNPASERGSSGNWDMIVNEMILSNWAKALGASHDREMAAKEKEEAESKKVQEAKVEAAKNAGAERDKMRDRFT